MEAFTLLPTNRKMPRHCSAGGCKSRDNPETRNAGITFHRLPKGATRRKLWITNSHRAGSWDPQSNFVYFCSKHFSPESFELTGCSGIRRLNEDAFPTVFDTSSSAKCKRARRALNGEDIPVRQSPCSGNPELTAHTADWYAGSEESTNPQSVPILKETNDNNSASGESSRLEQVSQKEHVPSPTPPPLSRSISPSRFMRRLPPSPGFYLSKEHSYAQLYPLLWRRRFDQAVDCLEKALRQLHAARRRENRLRSTVLRLREKNSKHNLPVTQDGRHKKTTVHSRRRGKVGPHQGGKETKDQSEGTGLFEDRCVDHITFGHDFPPDPGNSWSEEDSGYCVSCRKGQVQTRGQVSSTLSKTEKNKATLYEDSVRDQRCVETSVPGRTENTEIHEIHLGKTQKTDAIESIGALSQVPVKIPSLQSVISTRMSEQIIHKQHIHVLDPQQSLFIYDSCEATKAQPVDLQQQIFWIQDSAEREVVVVPVTSEDGLQSLFRKKGIADEIQTVLVSEHDNELIGHVTGNSGNMARSETSELHTDVRSETAEKRQDVREKIREHLEGFQLHLRSESN